MAVSVNKLLNPRFYVFRIQRAVRTPAWRDRVGRVVSGFKRQKGFVDAVPADLSGRLDREGFCWLGQVFTTDQLVEIRAFLESKQVTNFYRPQDSEFLPLGEGRHSTTHVANHRMEDVLLAPHLLPLANRPDVLGLIEEHLGCKPTITSLSAWWSFSTQVGPQHAELFHRDIDDWRFIKFFIYLTDVGPEQGPHVYIKNSTNSLKFWHAERYSDEEVIAEFGEANRLELSAPAGSAFLENTTGLHKGTPVKSGVRLLFQVVYGLSPLPDLPRDRALTRIEAEKMHGITLDPYVNRFLLA